MNQYSIETPVEREERFFSFVSPEPNSGCWLWMGGCRSQDKPRPAFGVNTKTVIAYRWTYEHFIGPIPTGLMVCHKCDVSICINPEHLFLGTNSINQLDSISKGRSGAQVHPEIFARLAAQLHELKRGKPLQIKIPNADKPGILLRVINGEPVKPIASEYSVSAQSLYKFIERQRLRSAEVKND